ncbi:MAG: glycosyltransferase family 9 protein [Selenomonadaceae bacterium]|nr:glycosyltransferase family 9 protein [Selenomonadaceae bacterium]
MRKKFVPQRDIDLVVGGLNKYFQRMVETHTFNPAEMKNFMEPIFTEAGYRRTSVEMNNTPNVLIIHSHWGVGDFISLSPSLRALRQIYSDANITLIVNSGSGNLAELCPYIDELILNPARYNWRDFLSIYQWNVELAKKLLLSRYDLVFPLAGFPSIFLLGYMGGGQKIFGLPPKSDNDILEPFGDKIYKPLMIEVPRPNPRVNEANIFSARMALVDSIAQHPITNREGEVWLSAGDRAFACDLLSAELSNGRKIYVICMGGSAPRKQWQPQNYARLAQMIVKQEPDTKFVILGGGHIDEQEATMFRQSVDEKFFNEHIINLTNMCTYRQSGAILELVDMYIGNDTGTMHMAAATKTPVLSPNCYSAERPLGGIPAIVYPYHVPSVTVLVEHALPECRDSKDGWGCRIANRPHCITQITVEKMFEAYNILKERIAANNIEPLFIS